MPASFSEEGSVLDLRVPEKQKSSPVYNTYPSAYLNNHAFWGYQQPNISKNSIKNTIPNPLFAFQTFFDFSPAAGSSTSIASPATVHVSPGYQQQSNRKASTQFTTPPNAPFAFHPVFNFAPVVEPSTSIARPVHASPSYQQKHSHKGRTQNTTIPNNLLTFGNPMQVSSVRESSTTLSQNLSTQNATAPNKSHILHSPLQVPLVVDPSTASPATNQNSPGYQLQQNQNGLTQNTINRNNLLSFGSPLQVSPNRESSTRSSQNSSTQNTAILNKSHSHHSSLEVSPVAESSTSTASTETTHVSPVCEQQSKTSTAIIESDAPENPVQVSTAGEPSTSTSSSADPFRKPQAPISKPARPFLSLLKDPLIGVKTAMSFSKNDIDYYTFRDKMLSQVDYNSNGSNPNMRRRMVTNEHISDPSYWEKRKKNNEAAKKSRDARRAREDEMAIRCAFLEQENMKLKFKVQTVHTDVQNLQKVVYKL